MVGRFGRLGGFRVWSLEWLSEAVKNRKCRAVWERGSLGGQGATGQLNEVMRLREFLRNENLKKVEVKQRLLREIFENFYI